MDIKSLISQASRFVNRNSNHILTILGAAGVVTTAVWTGKATVEATKAIEKYEVTQKYDFATLKEKLMISWPYYVPPVCIGSLTIACIFGANTVNCRRNAAIAGLYSITEKAFDDYKDKVREKIGEKKEEEIRTELIDQKLLENPSDNCYIIETGKGKTLFFDPLTARYFHSDIETVRRVVNDLNNDLFKINWVPLNDFYFALGLEGIEFGEDLGWSIDEMIDVQFYPRLTPNQEPCVAIDFDLRPSSLKKVDKYLI